MTSLFPDIRPDLEGAWITIGTFDGVHLGHRALITHLVNLAHTTGKPSLVITFWPHPATYFKRTPQAWALNTPQEREELLKEQGVDEVITLQFTQSLAEMSALDFLKDAKESLGFSGLMVGPNFALGKNREGNPDKLIQLSAELDFEVKIIQPVYQEEGMISSSLIRTDLLEGRVRSATQKLGRYYRLTGHVVHGEHRGTGLGVPTANLEYPPERLIPGNGVYVTRAFVQGRSYAAVTNIGVRPTFENPLAVPRIEPHLLDMDEQLYGKELSLDFIAYLRPEVKFDSSQELVAQIKKDISRAREFISSEGNGTDQIAI